MARKPEGKKTAISIIAGIIFFIIIVGINWLLSYLYTDTGLLIFYFFYVWFDESLGVVIFFLLFLLFFAYISRKDEEPINIKSSFLTFTVIALIYMAFTNIFEVSKKYEAVLIDNKTPSRFEYKYNILKDAIAGETVIETIPVENMEVYRNHYLSRSGRSTKGRDSYYIRFKINDIQYSSLEERMTTVYVDELLKFKEEITIEYYPHTGIVKSIDGVDKNNAKELKFYVLGSRDVARQEEESKEKESIIQEEEEKANSALEYIILSKSVGKNLSDVEQELAKNSVETSYKKVFISSKMFAVDSIAFYDDDILYVVKDNLTEDMVALPVIKEGMSREQIIDILTEAGFSYECDECNCDMHGKDRLHTKGHANGEYIPRQHTVWFSVDK